MKFEYCNSSNFDELMDFLHECFKTNDQEHPRFEELYPDIYRKDSELLTGILILRENGRIASSAGVFPIPLQIGNRGVVIPGVGGVATHPDFRGKSLMTKIMDEIKLMIEKENPPFSWLGGNRYRYSRWGWERAGTCVNFHLWSKNSSAMPQNEFKTRELPYSDIPWQDVMAFRKAISFRGNAALESLKYRYQRPALRFFVSENSEKEKAFLVLSNNNHIAEYFGSPKGISDIIVFLMKVISNIHVQVPMTNDSCFKIFRAFAETWEISHCSNLAVCNFRDCLSLAEENPAVHELKGLGNCGINLILADNKNPEQRVFVGIENARIIIDHRRDGFSEIKMNPLMAASVVFGPQKPSLLLERPDLFWLDAILPVVLNIPRLYYV
ncbi:MAG TPA: hypothetical protein DCZ94_01115 [Lentisphaeria bacterium]|nr:MAG: hypothetical protein A2X48_11660 [Lentisphaerae bacterium GWF2_49_21]HBC85531.1 hypothetical protein [Lentisphaeria bacterium]